MEALSKRLDGPVTPATVARAEARLLQLPQADCPLRHVFAAGVCIREVTMPAGTLIIGHAHRYADLNIMLTGRLTLLMEDGSLKELSAPQTFLGTPGRKIAYIHETVIWQNAWPLRVAVGHDVRSAEDSSPRPLQWTDLGTDVEAVEAYYLDKSPGWVADRAQRLAMERMAHEPDRDDYARFLAIYGLPAEDVRRISICEDDQIPMPAGVWKFQVGESAIEGRGILATATIAPHEIIGPARIGGKRTPLGRFTNHAAEPNATMEASRGRGNESSALLTSCPTDWDLVLVALRPIRGCAGGQPGEEITVDYEQALKANNALAVANAKAKGKILCQP